MSGVVITDNPSTVVVEDAGEVTLFVLDTGIPGPAGPAGTGSDAALTAMSATITDLTAEVAGINASVVTLTSELGFSPATYVAGQDLALGQPVYIDLVSGNLFLAEADALTKSNVLGLVSAVTASGAAAPVVTDSISLTDWTAIVGSATLSVGQRYYLGLTPGTLTTVAPTVPGEAVEVVGIAPSSDTLRIELFGPILL